MQKPIGIFDSGIGGLTVLKEMHSLLPNEDLIYFGDTARVPYGTKSRETVTRYSTEIAAFLTGLDVKMIVVACNSASALALQSLRSSFDVPVIGVIEPGAEKAIAATRNSRIGVIGTRATINSGAYEREILALSPSVTVFSKPCPVFVSLVEEGWTDHPATRLIAEEYLAPLTEQNIDTLVLGCTHYPLLAEMLKEIVGPGVSIVDSASSCAAVVRRTLEGNSMLHSQDEPGKVSCYVSDTPERFEELSSRFLGCTIHGVSTHRF